jgi:pyruvate dehydrogenase E2 component (dihydrolipoamide acetyltransferase)
MATPVILPALGMSQDTGKIVQWLKREGEHVRKGEPLVEIETDKATVEIEAPTDGTLERVTSVAGEDVPVGQVIALLLAAGEVLPENVVHKVEVQKPSHTLDSHATNGVASLPTPLSQKSSTEAARQSALAVSSLASRIAAEHHLDLSQVQASGKRIQKADVMAYLQSQTSSSGAGSTTSSPRLTMASPKARRLASEKGKDLAAIKGSGPAGAIIARDVLQTPVQAPLLQAIPIKTVASDEGMETSNGTIHELALNTTWRIMAQRTTQSWTTTPHFYLVRDVNASRLLTWREQLVKRASEKITYTDLLVKIVAASLRLHPRLNASWDEGTIRVKSDIHVGLAVAIEAGLVVPVIHLADTLHLDEIARQRKELVAKAQAGKLRPQDIQDATFTISNLGMYHVDAFHAIINQPQSAILAVGRIAERVVPLNGQVAIQPMMTLTLSCDHRAIDGARAAQFLATLAELIEEPLGLLA